MITLIKDPINKVRVFDALPFGDVDDFVLGDNTNRYIIAASTAPIAMLIDRPTANSIETCKSGKSKLYFPLKAFVPTEYPSTRSSGWFGIVNDKSSDDILS